MSLTTSPENGGYCKAGGSDWGAKLSAKAELAYWLKIPRIGLSRRSLEKRALDPGPGPSADRKLDVVKRQPRPMAAPPALQRRWGLKIENYIQLKVFVSLPPDIRRASGWVPHISY
jgi:hypothetical protein